MSQNIRILVIEDEKNIQNFITSVLNSQHYQVISSLTGRDGLSQAASASPDLILLDLGLPDMDGMEIIRKIREWSDTPILVISARVQEDDKVLALDSGADDYITKPFNPLELMARVKTQLRRYTRYNTAGVTQEQDEEIDIRGMHISNISHKCMLNGQEIALTPLEFDIVWYLARKQGKVVSSEELFEAVWKEKYLDNNNTVMAHIARIRDKMHETARKPKFIKTVWGVGYTIE